MPASLFGLGFGLGLQSPGGVKEDGVCQERPAKPGTGAMGSPEGGPYYN